ncbi:AcrR family transcriptional regulator [Paenibacillus phyllosphaerae]|uniref:AcrR family transcriptional regulator n=1 Tax=Paenibacillus phyllosphaerae TaxID=274593 RepID=A0A7W5AYL4_9BACL|nr:TetR/AcrR family transcriptional regulator [Paenibacillus phyllosphaerae]MBB3111180.1 AcrR family transcriptional regulator [Paenibacillus phyllosphaerae]
MHQIVTASIPVFARKGFEGTKISHIAEAAGLSQGHIYNYYASKRELFVNAVYWAMNMYGDIVDQAVQQPGTAIDKLTWHLDATLSHSMMADSILIISQAQLIDAVPRVHMDNVPHTGLDNLKPIIEILRRGQSEGSIRSGSPADLAVLYFSLILGFVLIGIRGYDNVMEAHYSASLVNLLKP